MNTIESEEYIQQIDRLMNLQNIYVSIVLGLIGLLIALAVIYQWKISEKDKENIKHSLETYADEKISILNNEIEEKITSSYGVNQANIDSLEEKMKTISGSNSNGFWTRFADGTQICRHQIILTLPKDRVISWEWTFPAGFLEDDLVVLGEVNGLPNTDLIMGRKNKNGQLFKLKRMPSSSTSKSNVKISLLAIGSWKNEASIISE